MEPCGLADGAAAQKAANEIQDAKSLKCNVCEKVV